MRKQEKPALISIDLDGTLIDSAPDIAWAADRALEALDYPPRGLEKVRNWVGNGVPMLLRRALGDGDENAITDPVLLQRAREQFDHFYGNHFADDSAIYPGVEETLQWLAAQDIPLAMITNKPIAFSVPMIEKFNLAPYFRWHLGGDSLAKAKPDPLPLLHVAAEAGVAPANCTHIGDSSTDVKAAKNAGFSCIAVSFGYNHGQPISESNPDHVVDHWSEIPELYQ